MHTFGDESCVVLSASCGEDLSRPGFTESVELPPVYTFGKQSVKPFSAHSSPQSLAVLPEAVCSARFGSVDDENQNVLTGAGLWGHVDGVRTQAHSVEPSVSVVRHTEDMQFCRILADALAAPQVD